MKRILSIVFLFALLATSCSEEELVKDQTSSYESLKFTASFEENNSRTYIEEGNLLRWNEGDQISLFVGSTLNQQYQFDGKTGANSGYFNKVNNSFGTGNDLDCHYAVYPYAPDIEITESGEITATLPPVQSYARNSFGLGANTMVAVTKDTDDTFLKFKNVGGYLKLQLYGDNVRVKSITITGNNYEKLAGIAVITPAYGQDPVVNTSYGYSSITLDCGNGVGLGHTAETATAFWIVVPPTIFEKGITVVIRDVEDRLHIQTTDKELVVERNVIKPMAAVEVIPKSYKSDIIFKEIYFCGSRSAKGDVYFRDQFYELYNNSDSTVYLDGLHIANLTPGKTTISLPTWEDKAGKYVYAERVWKFPGNGTDYPLQSGESVVISQFAANHQLEQYNPSSPIDGSSSEFEFNMNYPSFPDQPAHDMLHVFYNGKAEMGTVLQYLTPVFGPAMVIFRVPEGETWDPVNDASMKATDLNKPNSKNYYAKIPVEYVWDAVELGDNESKVNAKRIPSFLDSGMSWVGSAYCGLSVARYIEKDAYGNLKTLGNGSPLYMDTNNSTVDFERGLVPEMRRNGAKIPSWNTWK